MWEIDSYHSEYSKNDNQPVGIVTTDQSKVAMKFADNEVIADGDVIASLEIYWHRADPKSESICQR